MTAYDYGRQAWVTGADAEAVALKQVIEEQELVLSSAGDRYCRMLGVDRVSYRSKLAGRIRELLGAAS